MDHTRSVSSETDLISGERPHVVDVPMKLEVFHQADSVAAYPTQHLREMERDGLIVRTDLNGRVRHVEYSLSDSRGFAVLQLINALTEWGSRYASPLPKPEAVRSLSVPFIGPNEVANWPAGL